MPATGSGSVIVSGINGVASGSLPMSGSATSTVLVQGTASGDLPLTGSATGTVLVRGSASGDLPLAGSSSGTVLITATAAGSLPLTGSATGSTISGSIAIASGDLPLTGSATGTVLIRGSAAGNLSLTGTATGTSGVQAVVGTGVITNLLSVDYEDDWLYLDGIEDLGYEFDSAGVTNLAAPASGVKAKRASPTHNEVVVAASTIGYEPTDLVFVVFAPTLMSGSNPIRPSIGDRLVAFDCTWIIKSSKTLMDHSQYRCFCKRTTKEQ